MQSVSGKTFDSQFESVPASDAEAGDRDPTPGPMNDLRVEDLDKPTTPEGEDMPEDKAAETSDFGATSPVKKTVVSSTTAKANGTPTVKKVLNSGTFGSGSLRPTVSKPTTAGMTRSSAPVLKKSTTSPPSVGSKPALVSSTSSKPTTFPTRRMSVVPAKASAPSLARQSLSGPTTTKPEDPTLRASSTGSVGSNRSPIATPAAVRASVSETVRKPLTSSRPSMGGSANPLARGKASTVTRSSAAPTIKSSRPSGSISSIKELKEDGTKEALSDRILMLKGQLEEANKSLESKTAAVIDLEGTIAQLEASIASANVELISKTSSLSHLEEAKIATDSLLVAAQEALNQSQEESAKVKSALESVTNEFATAKVGVAAQEELIQSLQTQRSDLEAAITSYKEKMPELEANHVKAVAIMSEAISAERESHSKTQTDLRLRTEEIEAHRIAHAQELAARSAELKEIAGTTETLRARLTTLLEEKEESANKVSELEVEILELKETLEGFEDSRDALQRRVDELLQKLTDADAAAIKKDAEHCQTLTDLSAKHEQELEASVARVTEITAALDKLRAEYVEVVGSFERTKKDLVSKEEQHVLKFDEMEKAHADVHARLSSQLEEALRNLSDQESIYNAKVKEHDAEHAKLLSEAFERAKSEASHVHRLELQELCSNSNSTIKQLQEANRNALEELKAEHASALENEVGTLNKHINMLNLELKATQDDLVKAKGVLAASRGEIESLTRQRDDARAQADAALALKPEQAEEIVRLSKELESIKDESAKTTTTLSLTKLSMAELSDKHAKELEAAAKGRADEVLQLRAVHDAEVSGFATQKTELLVALSDLEGELATTKAALSAHEASSEKVNGVFHPPSPGVPREELQKLHEAHNLKIHDMQADHDKAVKLAQEELEVALNKISDLQQDVSRKEMEIQYLEQEQEESQEYIKRLKEDMEALSEKPQPA